MEDTLPPITQSSTNEATTGEQPIPPRLPPTEQPTKKTIVVPLLLGITILMLGAVFGVLLRQDLIKKPSITQSQLQTPTPIIVSNQPLSAIATTSAFMEAESAIASLSAEAASLNMNDTTVNPPIIDLPLGLDAK